VTIGLEVVASILSCAGMLANGQPVAAQQSAPKPAQVVVPSAPRSGQNSAATPAPPVAAQAGRGARAALPQGFSVVLVLGDIQGSATADDVPPAARKALVDMREFLPFKNYKLLDAAWLMCCGQDARASAQGRNLTTASSSRNVVSQMLRGPDDQEYELNLSTARADGAQVYVRFTLMGSHQTYADTAADTAAAQRTTNRRIADLKDRRSLLEKQIQEAQKRADVGVAPASEIPKLELEVRRIEREIEDLTARSAESVAGRATTRGPASGPRNTVIDTSFTMDVGETVVVGTSRLKGGSRALIALLTAVPPRAARKE
jgi:hypothetical protein